MAVLESNLAYYGIFGLWTLSNLALIKWLITNQEKREEKLTQLVENNTRAMTSFNERALRCHN